MTRASFENIDLNQLTTQLPFEVIDSDSTHAQAACKNNNSNQLMTQMDYSGFESIRLMNQLIFPGN